MTKVSLLAVVVFVACQPGQSETPPPMRRAPVQAVPTSSSVTPMRVTAGEPVALADAAAAPFTLTASDGSGLELTRIDGKAVAQGPLAFTELHLYFKNPEARTREGTFAITLPSGAAVSRFAMETGGKWQEAEVVEKAMARRVYDDYLHRRQDPALLEKAAGNQFTARVFPIPAKSEKHLVISFSQELAGRGYTLPLRGLPKTSRVDVVLTTTNLDGKTHQQTLNEKNWQPDRDFIAQVSDVAAAVTSGNVVVGAVALADGATSLDPPHGVTLLIDTSASRALGFAAYIKRVHALVDALRVRYGDELPLQVFAFDQFLELQQTGSADTYDDAIDQKLVDRGAAGASNLDSALRQLSKTDHLQRLVVVTDGVMTAGPETTALVDSAKAAGFERIDVVLSGGIRDERLAASVARALPRAGDVFDLDHGVDGVADGLGEAVSVNVAIDVPGATWVYPRTLPAARPGSTQMVFAKLAKPARTIDVVIGNARRAVVLGTTEPALIERAVAGAEIEDMENKLAATEGDEAKKLRADIAELSRRSRVVSSQTSMLVLESDADYERYQIERTALADILTIGPSGGLEQQHRTFVAANDKKPDTAKKQTSMALDEGQAGSPSARVNAVEQARNAGVLGSNTMSEGGSFASLTGTGDISSGLDDSNIYGGLVGSEDGEMNGGFGFGRAGAGPGGGGDGWGTIGTGRYGTIGRGSGTGSGYGIGGGRGGMRGRTAVLPTVALEQPTVQEGGLDRAIVRRYLKRQMQKFQYCYEKQLLATPDIKGTVTAQFFVAGTGAVTSASANGVHTEVASCIATVIGQIEFPRPVNGDMFRVDFALKFAPPSATPAPQPDFDQTADYDYSRYDTTDYDDGQYSGTDDGGGAPLEGKLAQVTAALKRHNIDKALSIAKPWHDGAPGDVLALIAYAETVQSSDPLLAARLYGSIIDLFPSRADMRRFAGERLEASSTENPIVDELVIDTYRKAVADRPDHATGHRLLAYALLRAKNYQGAFDAILAGVDTKYPNGRYLGADRVLRDDAGIIAAVYGKAQPDAAKAIWAELDKRQIKKATKSSTRFVMYWETDANDVDFHIRDARGGHAWYRYKKLRSGGELYADITTGYGPECFTIMGKPTAGPYKLSINYYSQGPMGYGMGLLQVMKFDGSTVTMQDRPYVIMTDHAFVELGSY
ncbi:MAG TPA: VIT domain-containing protein [Kofleriaceae bacterium]|nr:VIT domain-containing protein [Kofleriaceae bacterium]